MKTKNMTSKRILSFLLVLSMILGSFGMTDWGQGKVYAASANITKDVYLSFQDEGFIVPKQKVAVSSDLAEIYGYTDNVSSASAISALDVLVKTHEVSMGITGVPTEDDINNIKAMLTVNSSGFISNVMGETTGNFGFTINGSVPNDGTIGPWGYNGYSLNQAVVNENNNVEFFIYKDSTALDNYSWFKKGSSKVESITVLPNSNIELTLEGYCIGWYGLSTNPAIKTINDAQIVTVNGSNGVTTNWSGKTTGTNDGKVTLSFSTPGAYIVSAVADPDDVPLIMPWLNVTVIDPASNIPNDVPVDDVSTYVTITDANATYVTKQAINVGWFDIRPFIASGSENYVLSNKILTANALIEGVYYNLFGKDPTRADLQIAANSTTAQAIRTNLNIYVGKWGLSTGSVFGNDKLVMSTVNNNFGDFGIGGDLVGAGDDIVFYSYDKDYSYFEVMQVTTGSENWGTIYPTIDLKLKVSKKIYPSIVTEIEGASIYLTGGNYCYGTTSSNGVVNLHFVRSEIDPTGELVVTSVADGVIKPYLRVAYTWDKANVSITKVSQVIKSDTSLSSFKVNAYGSALDVSNYAGNNLPYEVDSNIDTVTLTAIATDGNAILNAVTVSGITTKSNMFSNSTGGSVSISLDPGLNTVTFNVKNGSDTEAYTLKINRSSASPNVITDVTQVINGIADYQGYANSVYDYNWIIGKSGAGKAITTAEKEGFLAQTLNDAATANVGSKAKMAIGLTALNIDATKVPSKNSDVITDLVAGVYNYSGDTIPFITYVPYMILLEDLGNYTIPANAKWGRAKLIQYALDNYSGYSGWNASNGIDGAAMMIPALAPYYKNAGNANGYNGISQASCAAIKVKVDEVVNQFKSSQSENGSFSNNADTTAVVIAALSSLGIDPDGSEFTKSASGKSALESIFAFKTTDSRLGFTSPTYSEFSSKDGLQALASYLKYYANGSKNGDGSVYRFSKEIEPYTSWPNAKLLTGIKITAPSNILYTYDSGKKSYAVDIQGMVVSAIYNGNQADTAVIPATSCSVSTIDRSVSGTQMVTVSYQGCTASFTVTVKNSDETLPVQATVGITVKNKGTVIAYLNSVVIEENKTTVLDVLKNALNSKGINYVIKSNTYVSEINGLGEFSEGANSGWLYSVNGVTPPITSSADYKLKAGDTVLWYYTKDYTTDSSTSNWKGLNPEVPKVSAGTATVGVTSKVDGAGNATVSVPYKDISTAITDAVKSAKDAGSNAKVEVQITVEGASKANSVETTILKASIDELKTKVDTVKVVTPIANISLDSDTMKSLSEEASGNLMITAKKLGASDIGNLSEDVKGQIGNKPIFDFSMKSGDKSISEFGGKVTISVPYEATDKEMKDGLVIYYINDKGNLEIIKDCIYDEKTKTMTFSTTHFSKYAIGYKAMDFNDVGNHWAKNYINYLTARNIVKGISEKTFAPNFNITRAQFVQILANLSGADLSLYNKDKKVIFNDVSEKSWYAGAASWGFENGIATGIKNNDGSISFGADTRISRQDMAVMLMRYNEKINKNATTAINKAAVFSDDSQIAAYAKDAVSQLQQAGLINGKTSAAFAPNDNATRAESAKIISILIENSL